MDKPNMGLLDAEKVQLREKVWETPLEFRKALLTNLDASISEMLVKLRKYEASCTTNRAGNKQMTIHNMLHDGEEEVVADIMNHEQSAPAVILCELKTRELMTEYDLGFPWINGVVGIVALLGKVEHPNLSKIFAEYVGQNTMMSIVCKTYDAVQALETSDDRNSRLINQNTGLHGLAKAYGKNLKGGFDAICLERLTPYVGDFVHQDSQRRLDLLKPKLPNGKCPEGFLGYAVNMIKLDVANLYYVTASGHGLRETLFYHIFNRVQVYRTRGQMLQACSCITHGALSLDGGIIKRPGVFVLGAPKDDVGIRFVVNPYRWGLPLGYMRAVEKLNYNKFKREQILEENRKQEMLLNQAKNRKQEVASGPGSFSGSGV